jgi:hypothetical protein
MKWQDKLTEEELAHVKEWGGKTLSGFKKNREVQLNIKARAIKQGFAFPEPCWACRQIAEKLGIE